MVLTKRQKRFIVKDPPNSMFKYHIDEMRGDVALYDRKPRKALKYYGTAIKDVFQDINHQVSRLQGKEGYQARLIRSNIRYKQEDYERITKKRDRIENSVSGKRKYLSGRDSKKDRGFYDGSGLASKVAGIISLISFAGTIAFLSPKITGNVIGASQTSSSWIALVLFFVGLTGAFAYFNKKKN